MTALQQTAPLILLLGAAVFFHEKLRRIQVVLILLVFAGALLVAQPGGQTFSPYALFGLGSAVAIAGRDLLGRRIHLEIPGIVVAVAAGWIEIIGAGIAGFFFERWLMPPLSALLLCGATAASLIAAQWLILAAYRTSNVSVVAPFFYMSTVWALISGFIVFGTIADAPGFVGMVLVVVAGGGTVVFEHNAKCRNSAMRQKSESTDISSQ